MVSPVTSPSPVQEPTASPERLPQLDGLRGIASLMVLIAHCVVSSPTYFDALTQRGYGAHDVTSFHWLMTYTPLHLLWAGTESLWVFFALSGSVLAHNMRHATRSGWAGYYVRRMIRLYAPVWGALVITVAVLTITAQLPKPSQQPEVYPTLSLSGLAHDAVLLHPLTGLQDRPLWTMRLEVLFSLSLPLMLLAAVALRRRLALSCASLLLMVYLGFTHGIVELEMLPIFALGVVLTVHTSWRDRLRSWMTRPARVWATLAIGIVALTVEWPVRALTADSTSAVRLDGLARTTSVATGVFVVALAWQWAPLSRWLCTAGPQWLGKRAFSIYLVHFPVLQLVVFTTDVNAPWFMLLVAGPLALGLAALFFRFWEAPSHRFAQWAGRRAKALVT